MHLNQTVCCPSTMSIEYPSHDSFLQNNLFGSNVAPLAAITTVGEDAVHSTLAHMHFPQAAQQQHPSSTMDSYSSLLANSVTNQLRFEHLGSRDPRQSSFTDMDHQTAPWTPLAMEGDDVFKSQWPQENRPASTQNLQVDLQTGKDSSVASRPRSDSGYGTVPNLDKSPHTVSTSTHSLFDGEMPSIHQEPSKIGQTPINFAQFEGGTTYQTNLDDNFRQFTDNYRDESPLLDHLPMSLDFESMTNQPAENGSFVCNQCLRNGETQAATQKNKSEWK